jgi:hypothetical protein
VLLAAEFLKECKAFVEEGVHPNVGSARGRRAGLQLWQAGGFLSCFSGGRWRSPSLFLEFASYTHTLHRMLSTISPVAGHAMPCPACLPAPSVCRPSSVASARRRRWRWRGCASWRLTLAARTWRSARGCWRSARRPHSTASWCAAALRVLGGFAVGGAALAAAALRREVLRRVCVVSCCGLALSQMRCPVFAWASRPTVFSRPVCPLITVCRR